MTSVILIPSTALAIFSDVPEDHEHYAAIQWMEGRSVIEGYDDGTFRPDQEVTRAEALKIILLGNEVEVEELDGTEEVIYSDVGLDAWFFPYVDMATDLEIVQGYDDGSFLPEQTVNLAETLKMIGLARGLSGSTPVDDPYADVSLDAWFAPYVEYCKDRNFIEAHDDGLLHPDWAVTRGALIELIYRFSYTDTYELETFDPSLNWPAYQHESQNFAFKAPFGWQVISGNNGELIVWHQDESNDQMDWGRTYDNSATITIFSETNGLSSTVYFSDIQNAYPVEGASFVQNSVNAGNAALVVSVDGSYEDYRDVYIEIESGTFISMRATYGNGLLNEQLAMQTLLIQDSVYYSEATEEVIIETEDPVEVVAQARTLIQVDGEGTNTLALFSDIELIETDTIGVGTGPVDYYYSVWGDVTLKYERSFDVILDIEEGQTTAF